MTAQPIASVDLSALLRWRLGEARRAGREHIRTPHAFEAHALAVAHACRQVAARLADAIPGPARPDPVAAFVAGAWHDAGKIWSGDDYHEIASAIELVRYGSAWGLVRGPEGAVAQTLRRAARAVLPHFALREQLRDDYVPSCGTRAALPQLLIDLGQLLDMTAAADLSTPFMPYTMDAQVLIYCDMLPHCAAANGARVERELERRWAEIVENARLHDPAIVPILREVRPRIYAACARVARLLCDPAAPVNERRSADRNHHPVLK